MGEGLPTKTLYFRPFFHTPSWFGLYNHQCYMVISQINKEEKDVDKQGEHFWSFYSFNTFFRDPPFWMLHWSPDVCFPIFENKKDAKSRDFIIKMSFLRSEWKTFLTVCKNVYNFKFLLIVCVNFEQSNKNKYGPQTFDLLSFAK